MSQNNPLLNGHMYEWTSIELSFPDLGLEDVTGFVRSMNFSIGLEPGMASGSESLPRGRTRGGGAALSGDIEFYEADFDDFVTKLVERGKRLFPDFKGTIGYMEVPFDLVANYSDLGAPVITRYFDSCRLTKEDGGASAGSSDPLVVKCSFSFMKPRRKGPNGEIQPISSRLRA